ncbi:hypothetical protein Javan290_0019 [Streptococcus phage Javan290]|uniref:DUF5361 domain-containing protein n=1 Tax=Streptococcus marmotae TaxID=1825069 RepID=UPI00082CB907|nr:DUF5361 domain-containing protein [Streptococcus marmotae]QBX26073.1 hypothetical protein Javan290_0019 [Streptococcus phage Javan290]
MIQTDEEALICDLAETYHIVDYRALPASKVAILAGGLRDDSRIKMILSHQEIAFDTLVLAGILDRLSLLYWAQTKDGQKGANPPVSIVNKLLHKEVERQELVFSSGEDFEKAKRALLEKIGGES